MSGNVWEWCNDRYSKYKSKTQFNPIGASSGSSRVYRGGSWNKYDTNCRVSNRYSSAPDDRYDNLGFRLAMSAE